MSEIKLKPCPFCGGEAVYVTSSNNSSHCCVGFDFEVKCKECKVGIPGRYEMKFYLGENGELKILADERPKAAERWNRRGKPK